MVSPKSTGFDLLSAGKNSSLNVKIFTLSRQNSKGLSVFENVLNVSKGKVRWVSKHKDPELSKDIGENSRFLKDPELFVIKTVEEYSETILDFLGEAEQGFSTVEDSILKNRTRRVMERIFLLKKDLLRIRQANRKLLRLASFLSRESKKNYQESVALYEKLLHIDDLVGNYNDLLSNLIDAHLTVISNKLNQVMKVLTIIATIAMPLTVISSIYGMNIELPLQHSAGSFGIVAGIMAAFALLMLFLFWKLGWFGEKN